MNELSPERIEARDKFRQRIMAIIAGRAIPHVVEYPGDYIDDEPEGKN